MFDNKRKQLAFRRPESVNGSKAGPKYAFRFKLKPKPAVERFSKEING